MAQKAVSQTVLIILFLLPILFRVNEADQPTTTTALGPVQAKMTNLLNALAILDRDGASYTLSRRLFDRSYNASLQFGRQQPLININSFLENGLTFFAPTNDAFENLPSGALESHSLLQKAQLLLAHFLPEYCTFSSLQRVGSRTVETLASGQDGKAFVLTFSTIGGEENQGNRVNVSSGLVETSISKVVRERFPYAVYEVDQVLWPFGI